MYSRRHNPIRIRRQPPGAVRQGSCIFHRPSSIHHRQSAGFTLIELLVVLTIIGVLASISFVVLADSLQNARIEATRATIGHLDIAMQDRLEDFERLNLDPIAERFQAANPNIPLEVAYLLIKKDRFRAAFPQREEDLWGFNGQSDEPYDPAAYGDDSPLLVAMWDAAAADWKTDSWMGRNTASAADSAELLYVALTDGSAFGPPPPGIDRITSSHVGDTDGDENLEFLDDWGQPLRFYNWPTRLVRPEGPGEDIDAALFALTVAVLTPDAPTLPPGTASLDFDLYAHPLNQDPDDVVGALSAAVALNIIPDLDESVFHTIDTWHVPLIVSGGPDEELGLNEPNAADELRLAQPLAADSSDTDNLDLLYDNITNRQR
jgi:prepilin-type N-terminal cleavage/methylation domain-containing protein